MNSATLPYQQARVARPFPSTLSITPKMVNALTTGSIVATVAGSGIVFASWDAATIGMVVTAIGSLITAIVAGVNAILNTRSKNNIEEMKAKMEAQLALSTTNSGTLNRLHTALAHNTAETVKSVVATDQMKLRVEQLEQKLPLPTETKKIE